jgi:hypothetical protein
VPTTSWLFATREIDTAQFIELKSGQQIDVPELGLDDSEWVVRRVATRLGTSMNEALVVQCSVLGDENAQVYVYYASSSLKSGLTTPSSVT